MGEQSDRVMNIACTCSPHPLALLPEGEGSDGLSKIEAKLLIFCTVQSEAVLKGSYLSGITNSAQRSVIKINAMRSVEFATPPIRSTFETASFIRNHTQYSL